MSAAWVLRFVSTGPPSIPTTYRDVRLSHATWMQLELKIVCSRLDYEPGRQRFEPFRARHFATTQRQNCEHVLRTLRKPSASAASPCPSGTASKAPRTSSVIWAPVKSATAAVPNKSIGNRSRKTPTRDQEAGLDQTRRSNEIYCAL